MPPFSAAVAASYASSALKNEQELFTSSHKSSFFFSFEMERELVEVTYWREGKQ
jgi:hypothetical protein